MVRKIIHCDCDCFYASVEMLDNPVLQGRPIAVGGDAAQRGVIATCNYEARARGVKSAMPTARAQQLCPELRVIAPNFSRYREISKRILSIFKDYTDKIEPLSLDEAYLDVSSTPLFQGSATRMAEDIRNRVKTEIGICISAGVAPNKFLAKVASDWRKPDGLFVITPTEINGFVASLPVKNIYGVGKVTTAKLNELGVNTCLDLQKFNKPTLVQHFGRFGVALYDRCRGIDDRAVEVNRIRKSVSAETTFQQDMMLEEAGDEIISALLSQLHQRLQNLDERPRLRKYFVKVRFSDFSTTTLERSESDSLEHCLNKHITEGVGQFILNALPVFRPLLVEAATRRSLALRLIGVGVRLHTDGIDSQYAQPHQLSLFTHDTNL
jgi:DNA polymerase-4